MAREIRSFRTMADYRQHYYGANAPAGLRSEPAGPVEEALAVLRASLTGERPPERQTQWKSGQAPDSIVISPDDQPEHAGPVGPDVT